MAYINVRRKLTSSQLSLPHGTKQKLECRPMPNVIAAVPNIGGALSESSVIPFLVQPAKFG